MARGTHGRGGPPPDPLALRRERDNGVWLTLPVEGRKGRAPAWPLSKATARERALWTREWKRPQAVAWEQLGMQTEVALFVRHLADAERPAATAAARTLVLRQMESLGLTTAGMARNRWRIGTPPAAAPARAPAGRAARDRFRVVPGGRGA